MNILFLDREPSLAAKRHTDQQVRDGVTTYAMILSAALRITKSRTDEFVYEADEDENHPCVLWAAESMSHWRWLWLLGHHVGNEYSKRFNDIHGDTRMLRCMPAPTKIRDIGWADPPQYVPEEHKSDDVVIAYRNYCSTEEVDILSR